MKVGAALLDVLEDAADDERLALLLLGGADVVRGTEELAVTVAFGKKLDEVNEVAVASDELEDSEIEVVLEMSELDADAVSLAFVATEKAENEVSEFELELGDSN